MQRQLKKDLWFAEQGYLFGTSEDLPSTIIRFSMKEKMADHIYYQDGKADELAYRVLAHLWNNEEWMKKIPTNKEEALELLVQDKISKADYNLYLLNFEKEKKK